MIYSGLHNTYAVNVNGRLLDLSSPVVMGILNVTPDSFYPASRAVAEEAIAGRVEEMISEGAAIIDVGAFSTRPGAYEVSEQEEMTRLQQALAVITKRHPETVLSVDTFRPDVARMAVEEYGVAFVNDVSEGGRSRVADMPVTPRGETVPAMFQMMARLRVPYILMSVEKDIEGMLKTWSEELNLLRSLGVKDVILDPGFGFGKTIDDNYRVMARMQNLKILGAPLLVGVSRKSMVYRLLDTSPEEALNGTTALHVVSLLKGASILRVHDVRQAVEAVRIVEKLRLMGNEKSTHIVL